MSPQIHALIGSILLPVAEDDDDDDDDDDGGGGGGGGGGTKGSDNCLLTVPGDRTNPIHAIGSQDASTNNTSTEQIL